MGIAHEGGTKKVKAEKDSQTGKWFILYRYTDWQGNRKKSTKRGFKTKHDAEEWLRKFLMTQQADLNMRFEDFLKLYYSDIETRLRENTMCTKKYIIDLKILPYFGKLPMNAIKPPDIRKWQNSLIRQGYSETYLKTIHNQLNAIFNYAVKYYDLKGNPCAKAGSMGKSHADEMQFWTKQEFSQFVDSVMNKHQSYMAFMVLYWTGMRIGELLALTVKDVDFEKRTISISKSYQRIERKDIVTAPKTPKSNRVISIPRFLAIDLQDYIGSLYDAQETDRLFPVTKYYLEHEMQRGIKESGVKRIRLHDLRHSHASLLIEMGFSPLEIAERLGHEKIETTLNTYAHLYPNKQERMADKLDTEYREGLSGYRISGGIMMSGLDKNRLRNQTICFRTTPEERRQIEARIITSGMPKGQYCIQSLLHQKIRIVVGKYQSDRLSLELRRLREAIEKLSDKEENQISPQLEECKALLSELQDLMQNAEINELSKVTFVDER